MLLLTTHCSYASFHPYKVDDHNFSKILEPLRESSSQDPVVGHLSQPPSSEDDKEPPCKVARKSCLSLAHPISFVGFVD
jgi:hypothetical protein